MKKQTYKMALPLFLLALLASCSSPIDLDKVKEHFLAHRLWFEQLNTIIRNDGRSSKNCLEIRLRWGDWGEPQRDKAEYYGLRKARYQAYISLLKRIDASKVSYCPANPSIPSDFAWTSITIASSGIAVSGCSTSLNLNSDKSIPKSEITPGYQHKEIPLIAGWYISHHCT